MLKRLLILMVFTYARVVVQAQDSTVSTTPSIPDSYSDKIGAKAEDVSKKLIKKNEKVLSQLKKQEEKILLRLAKIDSSKAKEIGLLAKDRNEQLEARLKNPGKLTQYIPGLDSMSTTLNFLKQTGAIYQHGEHL